MKPAVIAVSSLLVASLCAAGETPAQPAGTAKTAAPATTSTTAQTATAGAAADSPLVKAAKATNRSKKRIVITNESLKSSTGHVTTAKVLAPIYEPKVTEREYQQRLAATAKPADSQPAAEATTKDASPEKLRNLAEEADDPYSEMDPAMLEHQLEKNAQRAPKEEKKKP